MNQAIRYFRRTQTTAQLSQLFRIFSSSDKQGIPEDPEREPKQKKFLFSPPVERLKAPIKDNESLKRQITLNSPSAGDNQADYKSKSGMFSSNLK